MKGWRAAWRRDPEAARKWLDNVTLEGGEAETVQCAMIAAVAEIDSKAALALQNAAVEAGFSTELSAMPSEWKTLEPDEARAWVENLPEGHGRNSALTRLWIHQFEQDPVAMLDALPALMTQLPGESSEYTELANKTLKALGSRGRTATEDWIDRLPEPHRAGFASRYATTLAEGDPEAALDFLDAHPRSEGISSPSFQHILATWARQDPDAAAQRALSETDLALRELAIKNVAEVWKIVDPEAARTLLESLR